MPVQLAGAGGQRLIGPQQRLARKYAAYAAAAGTATTLHQGTALARKEDFLRLVPQVKLTVLSESISTDPNVIKQATCGL